MTPDESKKTTSIEYHASKNERKATADLIKKVREQLIFDTNARRMLGNVKAIQGAPDETGATQPLMYIKLDNFLKELENLIRTEAVSGTLAMQPNEFSKEVGDPTTNRIYTRTLGKIISKFDENLVWKRKEGDIGGIFYPSKFEIKAIFDLAQMEGITSGEDLKKALRKGKTVPEYGAAKLPPADRLYGLRGSKKVLANRAFVVIVEDVEEAGLSHDLQTPIKIDNYQNLVKYKKVRIEGVGPTTLNAYREDGKLRPKTKLDLLQMGVAFSVGMNESIIAPRPMMKPQILQLSDPDLPGLDKRNYYAFAISGFSGARGTATRVGAEKAMEGIQAMPEVDE